MVRAYARDEDHAKDLSQQVWLTLCRKREPYLGTGSFHNWLSRMAIRVCARDRRNTDVQAKALERYRDARQEDGSPGHEPNPLAEIEREEDMAEIWRVLPHLSRRELAAVELSILQQKSTGEAAEIMGAEASTVRSHLRHALARLRTLLQWEGP